jgi:flagellar assembly protein FliH
VALELARQVVRSELDQRPEAVLTVAEESLSVLLASARQIVVRLNPEDHALAQGSLTEVLQARGARLLPDSSVTRGGCVVESDIAVVDASVEARWHRAAAAMGSQTEWHNGHELPYVPVVREEGDDEDDSEDDVPPTGVAP